MLIVRSEVQAAKEECRQLATLFYAKLPRELRDEVYAYSCVEDDSLWIDHIQGGGHESSPPEYDLLDERIYPAYTRDDVRYNQDRECDVLERRAVLNSEYVGREVALEAATVYFSQNTFYVLFDKDLQSFLARDLLGLGIQPGKYVRSLHVAIRCEPLSRKMAYRHDFDGSAEAAFLDAKARNLRNGLAMMANTAKLDILLDITTNFKGFNYEYYRGSTPQAEENRKDDERCLSNILEAIWTPVQDLIVAGSNVKVAHDDPFAHYRRIGRLFDGTSVQRCKVRGRGRILYTSKVNETPGIPGLFLTAQCALYFPSHVDGR